MSGNYKKYLKYKMMRRRYYGFSDGSGVSDDVRIAVNVAIKNFLLSELAEMEFPSSLTAEERAYIHKLALSVGLRSKSRGRRSNRFLTVYKREGSTIVQADAQFHLSMVSRQLIQSLMSKHPLTNKERQDLLPLTERDRIGSADLREMNKALGRLPTGIAQTPPVALFTEDIKTFKRNLPIWPYRDEIIKTISNNQVCVIEGETGSGKTTQVPQFLLEHYNSIKKPCRIIITEPRRIAVVSVCERVCLERSEKVGEYVGFQIRLESRISPKTIVTFCTTGVLLRTLMCGESTMGNVTHIIVDEVHERDRYCDFLLIAVKDLLSKFRNLHVVLMSATLNSSSLSKYFMNCPIVSVPGRQYPVTEYYLEDILKMTGYESEKMAEIRYQMIAKKFQKQQLEEWKASISKTSETLPEENPTVPEEKVEKAAVRYRKPGLDPRVVAKLDNAITETFLNNKPEFLSVILEIILSENISPDYQHSETGITPLMVGAVRNNTEYLEQILNLGANIYIKSANDLSAIDWGNLLNHKEAVELILSYSDQCVQPCDDTSVIPNETTLSPEDRELLEIYQASFNDEVIDLDLLMSLLTYVHCTQPKGAILVFLTGYHDIISVKEKILADERKLSYHMRFVVFTLHSNMQTGDQRKVFRTMPPNVRKIILATNIAETSLTIDDVIYVIDGGKVKEKNFDPSTSVCTLSSVYISRAQALQRRGRAGRSQPGICYHLFSSFRFQTMEAQSTPEILRIPLQELCLHSKLLAPSNTPIADFLSKAIDPPPFLVTRNAVQMLKTIDVLDAWEDLTELGVHVLDLPVEPRLAKMLMYSCILKCVDPVLTIVCCLTYKEPFTLPPRPDQKLALNYARRKFAANSYSDHMVLLRVFQGWQQARNAGWEKGFCEKNFISAPTMDMVSGIRAQLLAQLRASGFVRSKHPGDIKDLNTNSENWAVVKAALCAGIYPNLARVDREQSVIRTKKECKVSFHPSSTLKDVPKDYRINVSQARRMAIESLPSDWIMYEELSRSGRLCHMKTCTLVNPITVAIFSGPARLPLESVIEAEEFRADEFGDPDSDSEVEEKPEQQTSTLKLDDWILFKVDSKAAHLALQLRQKWHSLFLRRMKGPGKPWTPADEAVVKTVVSIISAEEQALNLTQPSGVGQRPRPCNLDHGRDEEFYSNQNPLLPNSVARTSPTPGTSSAPDEGSEARSGNAGGSALDDSKFFLMKVHNAKALEDSMVKEAWWFPTLVERKLYRAFRGVSGAILFFTIQGSGNFQGVAKLIYNDQVANCNSMKFQWLRKGNVSYQTARAIVKSINEFKRTSVGRDLQEVDSKAGVALYSLWDKFYTVTPKPPNQVPVPDNRGASPAHDSSDSDIVMAE